MPRRLADSGMLPRACSSAKRMASISIASSVRWGGPTCCKSEQPGHIQSTRVVFLPVDAQFRSSGVGLGPALRQPGCTAAAVARQLPRKPAVLHHQWTEIHRVARPAPFKRPPQTPQPLPPNRQDRRAGPFGAGRGPELGVGLDLWPGLWPRRCHAAGGGHPCIADAGRSLAGREPVPQERHGGQDRPLGLEPDLCPLPRPGGDLGRHCARPAQA